MKPINRLNMTENTSLYWFTECAKRHGEKKCLKAQLLSAATGRPLLVLQEQAPQSANIASISICMHPSIRFHWFHRDS